MLLIDNKITDVVRIKPRQNCLEYINVVMLGIITDVYFPGVLLVVLPEQLRVVYNNCFLLGVRVNYNDEPIITLSENFKIIEV